MLISACFLLTACITATSAQYYEVPEAKLEAFKPKGFRVSIPDEPGVQLFAFHGNVNKEMEGLEAGQLSRDIIKTKNGRWVFNDDRLRLKVGDVMYYWLYVQYEGLGYQKLDQTWKVTELVDAPGAQQVSTSTRPVPSVTDVHPTQCDKTPTLVNGQSACAGKLIFEENFDALDPAKWQHDVKIAPSPDFEFVSFRSEANNSFIRNGILHVKPTLVSDQYGENFLTHGKLELNKCTGAAGSQECIKEAQFSYIIPPVFSARVTTRQSFSFCYGTVEIRAKLPAGDWIFPELWLEPRDAWYGKEYNSGRIRVAMARGNRELSMKDDPQGHIGERYLETGCVLGADQKVHSLEKNWKGGFGWCNNFHTYSMTWTKGDLTFKVDGQTIGVLSPPPGGFYNLPAFSGSRDILWSHGTKMAPFDKEFYLSIGLGVGGNRDFPDNCTTGLPQGGLHPKPWKNTDPKTMLNFWRDKDHWRPSWSEENSVLQVDYVKVWALEAEDRFR